MLAEELGANPVSLLQERAGIWIDKWQGRSSLRENVLCGLSNPQICHEPNKG